MPIWYVKLTIIVPSINLSLMLEIKLNDLLLFETELAIDIFNYCVSILTDFGIMKPENTFQNTRKKDMTIAAIWGFGVRAIVIMP